MKSYFNIIIIIIIPFASIINRSEWEEKKKGVRKQQTQIYSFINIFKNDETYF